MPIKEEKQVYERLEDIKTQIEALITEAGDLLRDNDTEDYLMAKKHWIANIRAQIYDEDETWTMRDTIYSLERKFIVRWKQRRQK
jgi:predicted metal-dependent hydrolase